MKFAKEYTNLIIESIKPGELDDLILTKNGWEELCETQESVYFWNNFTGNLGKLNLDTNKYQIFKPKSTK